MSKVFVEDIQKPRKLRGGKQI